MSRITARTWFSVLAFAGAFAVPAMSNHYYVNISVSDSGSNLGTSWATAFGGESGLHRALLAAAASGGSDIIWVAGGVNAATPAIYRPGNTRADSFDIPIDASVYGGFAGDEDINEFDQRNEFAHPTILDGDIGTVNDHSDDCYHVVTIGDADHTTTKLSGFTIQYGNADAASGVDSQGGGISVGGPDGGESPSLERLLIRNNKARFAGGGLFSRSSIVYLTNCRFEYNEVTDTTGAGGGIRLQEKSWAIIQNCTFYSNTSAGVGGAVAIDGHSYNPQTIFSNCTFNANTAAGRTIEGAIRYGHAVYSNPDRSVAKQRGRRLE